MQELTVYKQMTAGTEECLAVLKKEIGIKSGCIPFAVKLVGELKKLPLKTEQDHLDAANTILANLQTLYQGGIMPEDYDKIDFVKRGKVLTASARVEAFYRAAARKGYRISDTIIAVPKEDAGTTYFEENFYNGEIIYTLKDQRINPDRDITAERLISGYFDKFICRLEVREVKTQKRVVMVVCEMSNNEVLKISTVSEQGIYKSEWIEQPDGRGGTKKKKVLTGELNKGTFWINWTGEMVNKTVIRRALKRIKEVLPELTETIYAFEQDEEIITPETTTETEPLNIPMEEEKNVDIRHLTNEEKEECMEMYQLFQKNPKLMQEKIKEIKGMFQKGDNTQDIINKEYASIMAISKNEEAWSEIGEYFI